MRCLSERLAHGAQGERSLSKLTAKWHSSPIDTGLNSYLFNSKLAQCGKRVPIGGRTFSRDDLPFDGFGHSA